MQSYQVKLKGVKKLVKRLEEPGFPASVYSVFNYLMSKKGFKLPHIDIRRPLGTIEQLRIILEKKKKQSTCYL